MSRAEVEWARGPIQLDPVLRVLRDEGHILQQRGNRLRKLKFFVGVVRQAPVGGERFITVVRVRRIAAIELRCSHSMRTGSGFGGVSEVVAPGGVGPFPPVALLGRSARLRLQLLQAVAWDRVDQRIAIESRKLRAFGFDVHENGAVINGDDDLARARIVEMGKGDAELCADGVAQDDLVDVVELVPVIFDVCDVAEERFKAGATGDD
jgi:hypothetical protein